MARFRHEADPSAPIPEELVIGRPKGEQLQEILESYIAELPVGALLPSERVLAERLGVARMTVRQELDRLAGKGLVDRHHGRGTFVAEPRFVQSQRLSSFSEDMRSRGMVPGSRVISVRVRRASGLVASRLEVEPGARVVSLVRVRTGDGEPVALERTNLPAERFPGLHRADFSATSLYELLERRWHVKVHHGQQRVSAVLPDPADAEMLQTSPSLPAFLIERVTRDTQGTVVEYGRSLYRGDRYDVVMTVDRVHG